MRIVLLFNLAFLIFSSGFSQETRTLKGKILADSILAPVHVINLKQQKGNLSDLQGNFEISAAVGDSILFTSVQYQRKSLQVSRSMLEKGNIEVTLVEDLNELAEVRLHKFSGNLEKDLQKIDTYNLNELRIPYQKRDPITKDKRMLHTATTSAGGVPLDGLLNKLSGRLDMLKSHSQNEELKRIVQKIIASLPEDYFEEVLGISAKEGLNFVYYCAENHSLRDHSNDMLAVMNLFEEKINEFKEWRNL